MSRYVFEKKVTVDGRPFKAGAEIADGDIPADHVASCLRVGYLRVLPEVVIQPEVVPEEAELLDVAHDSEEALGEAVEVEPEADESLDVTEGDEEEAEPAEADEPHDSPKAKRKRRR